MSTRRDFITIISTATIFSLAGCSTDQSNNNTTTTTNQTDDFYNQTSVERDIEIPEDGYISRETGEPKEGVLEDAEPIEYLIAAEEAHNLAIETIVEADRNYRRMISYLQTDPPEFEMANEKQYAANYWARSAKQTHNTTISLLREINEEDAIGKVAENKKIIEEFITLTEDAKKLIEAYEQGRLGYVAENSDRIIKNYEKLRYELLMWGDIKRTITTEDYPGYDNKDEWIE